MLNIISIVVILPYSFLDPYSVSQVSEGQKRLMNQGLEPIVYPSLRRHRLSQQNVVYRFQADRPDFRADRPA